MAENSFAMLRSQHNQCTCSDKAFQLKCRGLQTRRKHSESTRSWRAISTYEQGEPCILPRPIPWGLQAHRGLRLNEWVMVLMANHLWVDFCQPFKLCSLRSLQRLPCRPLCWWLSRQMIMIRSTYHKHQGPVAVEGLAWPLCRCQSRIVKR